MSCTALSPRPPFCAKCEGPSASKILLSNPGPRQRTQRGAHFNKCVISMGSTLRKEYTYLTLGTSVSRSPTCSGKILNNQAGVREIRSEGTRLPAHLLVPL